MDDMPVKLITHPEPGLFGAAAAFATEQLWKREPRPGTPEAGAIFATGAVAGLCPITEANLGDGVFDATGFLAQGGRFGVGSDEAKAVREAWADVGVRWE